MFSVLANNRCPFDRADMSGSFYVGFGEISSRFQPDSVNRLNVKLRTGVTVTQLEHYDEAYKIRSKDPENCLSFVNQTGGFSFCNGEELFKLNEVVSV